MRLSILRPALALAFSIVIGAAAGHWVDASKEPDAVAELSAVGEPLAIDSNKSAKGDRLVVTVAFAQTSPSPSTLEMDGLTRSLESERAIVTASLPPEKPKPSPPQRAEAPNGLLSDGQIANIKTRLRLTAAQEGYWPAVETALRDVIKLQLRETRKKGAKDAVPVNVNSPEVQRLTAAAIPLLMRMREDQKNEVRKLARVIGLDAVASQI